LSGRRLLLQFDVSVVEQLRGGELSVELSELLGDRAAGSRGCQRRRGRSPDSKTALGTDDVPLVRTVLDIAADALPVRRIRVVPLKQHLEAKALRRVSYLLFSEGVYPTVDVLPGDHRLHFLDAHEVLLVKPPKPIDRDLQLPDQPFDVGWFDHDAVALACAVLGCPIVPLWELPRCSLDSAAAAVTGAGVAWRTR
jgi:hypothetical protein